MKTIKVLILLTVLGVAAGAGFIYSGVYNMGADEPHWPVTFKLIETLRERSIGTRAKDVDVPKLDDPALISEGGAHYSAMCAGCHLAPGMEDTEIRAGLYPQPPNLAEHKHAHGHDGAGPARQFWIIKHGIKMTAMPAWGTTHDDNSIWGLVAFLQKLPGMSPDEYAELTGEEGGHDHSPHSHGGEQADDHDPGADAAAPPEEIGHQGYSHSE